MVSSVEGNRNPSTNHVTLFVDYQYSRNKKKEFHEFKDSLRYTVSPEMPRMWERESKHKQENYKECETHFINQTYEFSMQSLGLRNRLKHRKTNSVN